MTVRWDGLDISELEANQLLHDPSLEFLEAEVDDEKNTIVIYLTPEQKEKAVAFLVAAVQSQRPPAMGNLLKRLGEPGREYRERAIAAAA